MHEMPEEKSERTSEQLRDQWVQLWSSLGVSENVAYEQFRDIVQRYGEPQRAYHTLEHINHCMRELQDAQSEGGDVTAIAIALWYHDAVYDVRAKDNEERSAELVRQVAEKMSLSKELSERVTKLILLTKHAGSLGENIDKDAQLLMDIDLAILGQSEEEFDKYDVNIRREYAWVPEEQYRVGRTKVLQAFLDREYIFETDFFRKKYEKSARNNIHRAIARLKGESL